MVKKEKTAADNQWASIPEDSPEKINSSHRQEKTAGDNQWTSTIKNHINEK
ncbi:MAG: hypothetical protein ABF633_05935 [Clostridium sp.]|uniref:hypothetical protein n=1 Tax=Clostridium sp. TaxID=1506 RepID=UPI0039EBA280